LPTVLNPELEYLAPEYGLSSKCDTSSDMFSYGMLFYSVFNNGKSLYKCNSSYSSFISNVEELRKMTNSQFGAIPADVREYLKLLMHINPELRPDASQVMKVHTNMQFAHLYSRNKLKPGRFFSNK
jgi:SCY1-like protein 2